MEDANGNEPVDSWTGYRGALRPRVPRAHSSSSPKKKRCAQRWLQKVRPYSRLPQSWQTHLKQIGHFCRVTSSSLFWQLTQVVSGSTGEQYIAAAEAARVS